MRPTVRQVLDARSHSRLAILLDNIWYDTHQSFWGHDESVFDISLDDARLFALFCLEASKGGSR